MRILMLQPPASQNIARRDERLDDGLVGVALGALVVDDAPRATFGLRAKPGDFLRVKAIGVNGIGNARVDISGCEFSAIRHPDIKILATMAGRRVHEARAGVVCDVIAIEQRHVEIVAERRKRMGANQPPKLVGGSVTYNFVGIDFRGLENLVNELLRENVSRPRFRPVSVRRRHDPIHAIFDLVGKRDCSIARQRPRSRCPDHD